MFAVTLKMGSSFHLPEEASGTRRAYFLACTAEGRLNTISHLFFGALMSLGNSCYYAVSTVLGTLYQLPKGLQAAGKHFGQEGNNLLTMIASFASTLIFMIGALVDPSWVKGHFDVCEKPYFYPLKYALKELGREMSQEASKEVLIQEIIQAAKDKPSVPLTLFVQEELKNAMEKGEYEHYLLARELKKFGKEADPDKEKMRWALQKAVMENPQTPLSPFAQEQIGTIGNLVRELQRLGKTIPEESTEEGLRKLLIKGLLEKPYNLSSFAQEELKHAISKDESLRWTLYKKTQILISTSTFVYEQTKTIRKLVGELQTVGKTVPEESTEEELRKLLIEGLLERPDVYLTPLAQEQIRQEMNENEYAHFLLARELRKFGKEANPDKEKMKWALYKAAQQNHYTVPSNFALNQIRTIRKLVQELQGIGKTVPEESTEEGLRKLLVVGLLENPQVPLTLFAKEQIKKGMSESAHEHYLLKREAKGLGISVSQNANVEELKWALYQASQKNGSILFSPLAQEKIGNISCLVVELAMLGMTTSECVTEAYLKKLLFELCDQANLSPKAKELIKEEPSKKASAERFFGRHHRLSPNFLATIQPYIDDLQAKQGGIKADKSPEERKIEALIEEIETATKQLINLLKFLHKGASGGSVTHFPNKFEERHAEYSGKRSEDILRLNNVYNTYRITLNGINRKLKSK